MRIEPDNILFLSSIALLLGNWSFMVCYFLFSKKKWLFYTVFTGVIVSDLSLIYLTEGFVILLMLCCVVVALFAAIAHSKLDVKIGIGRGTDGCFHLFWLHYTAANLIPLFLLILHKTGRSSSLYLYLSPFLFDAYLTPLLLIAPSLGLIPLYMYKSYRPRPGMDTHFPDAGNN